MVYYTPKFRTMQLKRYFMLVLSLKTSIRLHLLFLSINLLKDMASPYYEFRTRTTAMSALKRQGYLDAQLAQNLFDAFLNFNSRLAGPAGEVIKYFAQNSANKALLLEQIKQYKTVDSNATLSAQNQLLKLLQ